MFHLFAQVTHLLAGQAVKKVEAAVCHVQTRYRPLRKVMSFQGPSCDALTGKLMLINVPEGIFCHLHCYRNVRCQSTWSGVGQLVCSRLQVR